MPLETYSLQIWFSQPPWGRGIECCPFSHKRKLRFKAALYLKLSSVWIDRPWRQNQSTAPTQPSGLTCLDVATALKVLLQKRIEMEANSPQVFKWSVAASVAWKWLPDNESLQETSSFGTYGTCAMYKSV